MSNLILPRRRFLTGLATLFAAPAIVRVASLMPVKAVEPIEPAWAPGLRYAAIRREVPYTKWRMFNQGVPIEKLDPRLAAYDWSTAHFGESWTDHLIPQHIRPNPLEHRA